MSQSHVWSIDDRNAVSIDLRSLHPNIVLFDVFHDEVGSKSILGSFGSGGAQPPETFGGWTCEISAATVQSIIGSFPVIDGDWLTVQTRHRQVTGSPTTLWGWTYRINGATPGSGKLLDGTALSVDADGWVTTGATRRSFTNDQFELDFLSIDFRA